MRSGHLPRTFARASCPIRSGPLVHVLYSARSTYAIAWACWRRHNDQSNRPSRLRPPSWPSYPSVQMRHTRSIWSCLPPSSTKKAKGPSLLGCLQKLSKRDPTVRTFAAVQTIDGHILLKLVIILQLESEAIDQQSEHVLFRTIMKPSLIVELCKRLVDRAVETLGDHRSA